LTRSRRKAREAVLQALYWSESTGESVQQTLHTMAIRTDLSPDASEFAASLGSQAWDRREEFDRAVGASLENWTVARLARIDRIVLWMALTEISAFADIPTKVSINEAIELAKRYSAQKSPGFVNGVLDTIAKQKGLAPHTRYNAETGPTHSTG